MLNCLFNNGIMSLFFFENREFTAWYSEIFKPSIENSILRELAVLESECYQEYDRISWYLSSSHILYEI